eukprot:TRINITY_DN10059_c0_g1_i1.p2 TRINITY_DN10059_c0_g1~~TRINITY_DN10059_c0_g1_i1.p2  ORF type:complete len:217 (+),score=69.96 TRINITY_DN10059_c0_g1_i1:136-786(+)
MAATALATTGGMAPSKYSFQMVSSLESFDLSVPAFALATAVECNINDNHCHGTQSPFDGVSVARISIQDYLIRLMRASFCSKEVLPFAAFFVRRMRLQSGVALTSLNVHRVLLAAFVISAKLRDDVFYSNRYYAKVGGVSTTELMRLEVMMLACLGWDLSVDPGEYHSFRSTLLHWEAAQMAIKDDVDDDEALDVTESPVETTPGPDNVEDTSRGE